MVDCRVQGCVLNYGTNSNLYIYIYMFYDVLSLFCHAMIMVVLGLVFGHSDRISTWTNNDGNMTQLQTREFKPQKHGDMMYGLQTKMTFLPKDIEISSNQEIGISANKHGDTSWSINGRSPGSNWWSYVNVPYVWPYELGVYPLT